MNYCEYESSSQNLKGDKNTLSLHKFFQRNKRSSLFCSIVRNKWNTFYKLLQNWQALKHNIPSLTIEYPEKNFPVTKRPSLVRLPGEMMLMPSEAEWEMLMLESKGEAMTVWIQCYQTFSSSSLKLGTSKLERLFLVSLFRLRKAYKGQMLYLICPGYQIV